MDKNISYFKTSKLTVLSSAILFLSLQVGALNIARAGNPALIAPPPQKEIDHYALVFEGLLQNKTKQVTHYCGYFNRNRICRSLIRFVDNATGDVARSFYTVVGFLDVIAIDAYIEIDSDDVDDRGKFFQLNDMIDDGIFEPLFFGKPFVTSTGSSYLKLFNLPLPIRPGNWTADVSLIFDRNDHFESASFFNSRGRYEGESGTRHYLHTNTPDLAPDLLKRYLAAIQNAG